MADEDHPEDKSDIPILTLPPEGFKSRIPPSLLQDKSKEEQDLYNDISKMVAAIEWIAPAMVVLNSQLRHTNGKVSTLWALKNLFSGYKGLVIALFGIIGAIAGAVQSVQYFKEVLSPPAQSAPANPATQVPVNRPFP